MTAVGRACYACRDDGGAAGFYTRRILPSASDDGYWIVLLTVGE
jgi:hypothetical protein